MGDDLYSYGFDGAFLWTGGRSTRVMNESTEPFIRKSKEDIVKKIFLIKYLILADVIGCALDLTIPIITFTFNGALVRGSFRNFNLDGMFFPVISCSSKLR